MSRLLLAAFVAFSAASAADLRPKTILPEGQAIPTEARRNGTPETPRPFRPLVGTVDTVGGTTYDWWYGGSTWRQLYNEPGFGLYATWMYSQSTTSTSFADRNMRYSFYDYATHRWNWIDSADYMQSGVNTFIERSGYGSIGAEPATGCAVIARHSSQTGTIHAEVAREMAAGSGVLEYADGGGVTDNYQWPPIAVDGAGVIHQFMMMATYYLAASRVATWPTYEPLVTTGWEPATTFLSHNIAASQVSQKVACTWTDNVDPVSLGGLRTSENGGVTWGTSQTLVAPAVFGGDTIASWHITSLFPWYDHEDQLHIVANVMPVVHDTGYIMPAVMCHYLNGTWSVIARAGCDPAHLMASVGYNAMYADRPTIGEDRWGGLHVVWEQFDSMNVEPATEVLRADIFYSTSRDNGATWSVPERLTDAGTHSCRTATASQWLGDRDTFDVLYLLDQTAGFWVQNEHPGEINPVIVQHIPIVPAVEEQAAASPSQVELAVLPSTVRGSALVSYATPNAGDVAVFLCDASGRVVQTLASGHREAGRFTARLSAASLAAGVYFCTLESGARTTSAKLTITR
jgi:hypothetical protein